VLKVAHHGSGTSTSSPFLDLVSPQAAVISSSVGNPFGHPAEATLKKLADRGIGIYRTDQHGTIIMLTDGKSFHLAEEK
jgi:competence protein ComEC